MDGLSGAASGIAVVSLAVQLGASIKQLSDFWDSVKDAPDDIHAVTTDLYLLSGVLGEIASEEQHCAPDKTLTALLETCRDKINKLARMTDDLEPGFSSRSLGTRKWTALKAVVRGEKVRKFQKVLEGLKFTLLLAQQNHHSRLNRIRYQSQQQDLTTITKCLSSVNLEQLSATITTLSNGSSGLLEHTAALHKEAAQICRTIQNPVQRLGYELGSDIAVQALARDHSKDQRMVSRSPTIPEGGNSNLSHREEQLYRSKKRTLKKYLLDIQSSFTQTLFGTISTTTKSRSLRSSSIDYDDALDDKDYQYEQESSLKILPAQWLLRLGFRYAYNFSTYDSSTQGWQWSIRPINLVPNDAPIFRFCKNGDLEKVRDLISKNLASVRDVDSDGYTALHFAVRSHSPELCKFLTEAGADKNASTFDSRFPESPLMQIDYQLRIKGDLVDMIDTCRIFEASFDFWDDDGDGWQLLGKLITLFWSIYSVKADALTPFLSWFIQSSSSDIQANYKALDLDRFLYLGDDEWPDSLDLLLSLSSPKELNDIDQTSRVPFLFRPILEGRCKIVNTLLSSGIDPHRVHSDSFLSPVPESSLSLAMYHSWTFLNFRNALRRIYPDVEQIARQELKEGSPLLDAGWQVETLICLLELDFEPDNESSPAAWSCSCCGDFLGVIRVQPFWQGILDSIKDGSYQQKILSDAQGEQPPSPRDDPQIPNMSSRTDNMNGCGSSQKRTLSTNEAFKSDEESFISKNDTPSFVFDRKVRWCVWCWHHYKKTGQRRSPVILEPIFLVEDDSSEDDFSPYLFNT